MPIFRASTTEQDAQRAKEELKAFGAKFDEVVLLATTSKTNLALR
ncbi:hypothetical protein [Photobacterium leiognathi]|nr:hypothetical protein [Photobacterium leiognathi]